MNVRISASLVINDMGQIACMDCGHEFGPQGKPWKEAAQIDEAPLKGSGGHPYSNASNILLRRFYCPGCAKLIDTETALHGDPFLNDIVKL